MSNWFYADQGQQRGPVGDRELQGMLASGVLPPTTLVWREGMPDWQPISSVVAVPPSPTVPAQPMQAQSLAYASPMPHAGDEMGQNAGMRMLLPVGRSGWAIASGYLGLLSILMFPAPFALITGIIAIIHMKRNPRVHGMGRAIFGIVMGLLGCALFVLFIVGSLVG